MSLKKRLRTRSAAEYAAFFTPYLRDGMSLLDCGCGDGPITLGLADQFDFERLVGLDFAEDFREARDYARAHGLSKLHFLHGDANALPFPEATFDAVYAHSMVETLDTPVEALREMRRVLVEGGPIGVASVEYGGVLIAGPSEDLLRRFYALREQQWALRGQAEPRRGVRLRGLLHEAGFRDVVASARYISYGTPEALRQFGEDRAVQCEAGDYAEDVVEFGLATEAELRDMAEAWHAWGESPNAFFAFPWCMAVGYR